jgi:hypothetical protein
MSLTPISFLFSPVVELLPGYGHQKQGRLSLLGPLPILPTDPTLVSTALDLYLPSTSIMLFLLFLRLSHIILSHYASGSSLRRLLFAR